MNVQFRAGTYFLPATEMFTAADSGSATTQIVYQNYPGESPVISGGVRVQNWTNVERQHLEDHAARLHAIFREPVLQRSAAASAAPGRGMCLGTYYRIAATVYLNATAPPAGQAPDAELFGLCRGQRMGMLSTASSTARRTRSSGTWKNLAPAAGNPCGQPAGNPALAGDIELLDFEQYTASKLRISCVDTANQIVYLTGADRD